MFNIPVSFLQDVFSLIIQKCCRSSLCTHQKTGWRKHFTKIRILLYITKRLRSKYSAVFSYRNSFSLFYRLTALHEKLHRIPFTSSIGRLAIKFLIKTKMSKRDSNILLLVLNLTQGNNNK